MKRLLLSIVNNDRSLYYIVLFFIAVSLLFSGLYCIVLPSFTGSPVLMHNLQGVNTPAAVTYLDCFYFSMTTQTTVGYGDIVAASNPGKILSIIQSAFGYFYLAFSIAIFACRGIIRSQKFELLLHSYQRDVAGANDAIGNN